MWPASRNVSVTPGSTSVARPYGTGLNWLERLVRVPRVNSGSGPRACDAVLGLPAAVALRLALAIEGAVREQDAREVAARRGRVDRPAEAALAQQRQPAAVVDVRVAQHHRVDRRGVERKRLRDCARRGRRRPGSARSRAAACGRRTVEDVAGAGDLTGGAVELQVHRANRLRRFAARRALRLPDGPERSSPARPAAA